MAARPARTESASLTAKRNWPRGCTCWVCKKGWVPMRKHISNCSEAEVKAVTTRVQALAASRAFVDHAAERMHHKNVSAREIEIALRYGQPIEVHAETGEWRALIMHSFGKPKVKVNVVINLVDGKIITTWKNNA